MTVLGTFRHGDPARRAILRAGRTGTVAALVTILVAALAAPAAAAEAPQAMTPACDGVNIRSGPSTSATTKVRLGLAASLTVTGTVAGSSWGTSCQTWTSGSTWFVVSHVNGEPVSTTYGVPALYAATGVLRAAVVSPPPDPAATSAPTPAASPAASAPPTPEPAATPPPPATPASAGTPTPPATPATPAATAPAATPAGSPGGSAAATSGIALVPACDGINLRVSATTRSTLKARLGINSTVTISGTVTGKAWRTACPTSKSGAGWYRISHVNGSPVQALYGVAAVYAATGVLAAPPTAASSGLTVLGPSTTFFGRGYGHGVGLSQYGARGRALAGQAASEILVHYFPGTTLGAISTETRIRVLVLDDFGPTSSAPLTVVGQGGAWTISGIATVFPADARLRVFAPATAGAPWRLLVDLAGSVLHDGPPGTDLRLAGATPATTFHLDSKPSQYDLYRGELRLLRSGTRLDVINELPLETYLRGVVPGEMPSSWPLEARTAQTIAARSYAAYRLHPTTGTFDVYDDTRSQVYGGVRRETAASDAVIAATAGQVLLTGTAIANAHFHSTGGGATEHNENAFTSSTGAIVARPAGYLRGSPDRDAAGVPYDAAAPYATWQTRAYAVAELSAIFAKDAKTNVGTVTALDLRRRGVSKRLISVTLVGTGGSKTVSGELFVSIFNAGRPAGDAPLRGSLFDVRPIP